jgi:hypothetical protein
MCNYRYYRHLKPKTEMAGKRRKIQQEAAVITNEEYQLALQSLVCSSSKKLKRSENDKPPVNISKDDDFSDIESTPLSLRYRAEQILSHRSTTTGDYCVVRITPQGKKKADVAQS